MIEGADESRRRGRPLGGAAARRRSIGPDQLGIAVAPTATGRQAWRDLRWLPHGADPAALGLARRRRRRGRRTSSPRPTRRLGAESAILVLWIIAHRRAPRPEGVRRAEGARRSGPIADRPAGQGSTDVVDDIVLEPLEPEDSEPLARRSPARPLRPHPGGGRRARAPSTTRMSSSTRSGCATSSRPPTCWSTRPRSRPGGPSSRADHLATPSGSTSTAGWSTSTCAHDGPHALVAGTTGAGKSELLRTLLVSAALHHSPDRLQFLLVDYKGGAAFGPLDRTCPTRWARSRTCSGPLARRAPRVAARRAPSPGGGRRVARRGPLGRAPALWSWSTSWRPWWRSNPTSSTVWSTSPNVAAASASTWCSPRSDPPGSSPTRSGPTPRCGSRCASPTRTTATTSWTPPRQPTCRASCRDVRWCGWARRGVATVQVAFCGAPPRPDASVDIEPWDRAGGGARSLDVPRRHGDDAVTGTATGATTELALAVSTVVDRSAARGPAARRDAPGSSRCPPPSISTGCPRSTHHGALVIGSLDRPDLGAASRSRSTWSDEGGLVVIGASGAGCQHRGPHDRGGGRP